MTRGERLVDAGLALLLALTLVALYAPVALVVAGAFLLDGSGGWGAPTLRWFAAMGSDRQLMAALVNTCVVAIGAVTLSLVLGLSVALHLHARPRRSNGPLQVLVLLPFVLPPLVTGLSLLIALREAGVGTGRAAVVLGHALFALALVTRTILNRLVQDGSAVIEASLDLGATPAQTFARVVLPRLRTALLTAAVLAFALSFDETLITLFLVGDANTLPIQLWAMMRTGLTPATNAVATLVLGVSLLAALLAAWAAGRRPD